MGLNYLAIIIATILQFIAGAVWYMAIFGKTWGKIHGFEKYSKEEQQMMAKKMGPFYGLQILTTLLTTFVLALFEANFVSGWHAFGIAGFCWLGFVLPTQISAVIFGGTEPKWIAQKIGIMAGGSLTFLMIAAAVLFYM